MISRGRLPEADRGSVRDLTAIILLFVALGPLLGGLNHLLLMLLLEATAMPDEGPSIVVTLVTLSYVVGFLPALTIGFGMAWRRRRVVAVPLRFASGFALVSSLVTVGLVWIIASGESISSPDPILREQQLRDAFSFFFVVAFHSSVAAVGCWLVGRRVRLF